MNIDPHTRRSKPVLVGEVLYDVFADGKEVPGGAPFNVAWHLQGFGRSPLFISRVGRDARGENILATMRRWGMDTRGIQTDADRPTGEVKALVVDGQPQFRIAADQAYDHLAYDSALAAAESPDRLLLYHGTLALRSPTTRRTLQRLLEALEPSVLVDVNLREPWWTPDLVDGALGHARWVKVNEDELARLTDARTAAASLEDAATVLIERHDLASVIITRGDQGVVWVDRSGAVHEAPAVPVAELADTIGAGDAFCAVAMLGLGEGWPVTTLLRRASEFAAAICGVKGATVFAPELYAGYRKAWTDRGGADHEPR